MCVNIFFVNLVQFNILLRYTVLKLKVLTWCSVYLHCGSNCYVTAVVYLACEDVVLGSGCVGVFILVSAVKRSFGGCWFWSSYVLCVRSWYMFYIVLLGEGTVLSQYVCVSLYIVTTILTLLGPDILRSTLFSNTLSLRSTLNVTDHVSHPYKTTSKIIILYIGCLKTDRNRKRSV